MSIIIDSMELYCPLGTVKVSQGVHCLVEFRLVNPVVRSIQISGQGGCGVPDDVVS